MDANLEFKAKNLILELILDFNPFIEIDCSHITLYQTIALNLSQKCKNPREGHGAVVLNLKSEVHLCCTYLSGLFSIAAMRICLFEIMKNSRSIINL